MIKHEKLIPYTERYAALPMAGVHVRIAMKGYAQTANFAPINFDNLLAWCVQHEATLGAGLSSAVSRPYELPAPIRILWRDHNGYPLYASSALLHSPDAAKDTAYLHKRMQTGKFSKAPKGAPGGKLRLESNKGRDMERRVALPTATYSYCEAFCMGNAEEIKRLLRYVTNLGKRRHSGHGQISGFVVAEMPGLTARDCFVRDGRLTRAFPLAAINLLEGAQPEGSIGNVAFSPPYWKEGMEARGWFAGTPVEPVATEAP